MANNEATVDQVSDDISESTNGTVDQIGNNVNSIFSDLGTSVKQAILDKFDSALQPPTPDSVPVPDIVTSTMSHEHAHEILKEATDKTLIDAPGNLTTVRDQLKQAKEQFSKIG